MRYVLSLTVLLFLAGCTPSTLLNIDRTPAGVTGARATGQFPDIQAVPPRAARQLDAEDYADIRTELSAEANDAARLPAVNASSADRRARSLLQEAKADERRLRDRIRRSGAD